MHLYPVTIRRGYSRGGKRVKRAGVPSSIGGWVCGEEGKGMDVEHGV